MQFRNKNFSHFFRLQQTYKFSTRDLRIEVTGISFTMSTKTNTLHQLCKSSPWKNQLEGEIVAKTNELTDPQNRDVCQRQRKR